MVLSTEPLSRRVPANKEKRMSTHSVDDFFVNLMTRVNNKVLTSVVINHTLVYIYIYIYIYIYSHTFAN